MAPTALLIMDVQQGLVERFPGDAGGYLERLATAIAAARAAAVMVGYVAVGFRPGYPEVSDRNKSFAAITGTGRFTDGDPGRAISDTVAPAAEDVVHRVLLEKVFPRQAEVTSVAEWVASLRRG